MQKKHLGARNELMAVCWLMECGYEVFRNVSQHGPIDVIALKEGEPPLYLDVKSALAQAKPEQLRLGVKILVQRNGQFYIEDFLNKNEVSCVVCGKSLGHTRQRYCSSTCKNGVLKDIARRRYLAKKAEKADTTVVPFTYYPRVVRQTALRARKFVRRAVL